MKNIIFFLATFFLFSCGMKKELTSLKTEHKTLQNNYTELQKKYTEAKENGAELERAKADILKNESNISKLKEEINALKDSNEELIKTFPVLKFYKPHYSFGQIKMKSENEHIFHFKNMGNSPLVITGVDVDCSCTVPKYPDFAIMPGESSKITLEYIPSIPTGVQRKTIGILCNTKEGIVKITTYADVLPADEKK